MTNDYRLKILYHLRDSYPNKANISHILKEFLATNASRPDLKNILTTLKDDGFVKFGDEVIDGIIVSHGQVYNDNNLMVCLTHPGLDEIKRIEKQDYDLKNAERVYKTYRSTRVMAIIAFIISLLLGLLKLTEEIGWQPWRR